MRQRLGWFAKNRTESVCDPYRTVGDFHESDAFRPGRDRILSLAYMTFLPEMPPLKAGYGATDARWFAFSAEDGHYVVRNGALHFKASEATSQAKYYENAEYDPETHLAFDYDWIFKVACERIRNKLNYRPNVLLVLGSTFTMREARCVYAPFLMKKSTKSTIPTSEKRICIC